jgi:hypothetical protein
MVWFAAGKSVWGVCSLYLSLDELCKKGKRTRLVHEIPTTTQSGAQPAKCAERF